MPEFSTLSFGCPKCGHRTMLTIAGWNPDKQVKSSYWCPGCKKLNWLTLPGRVVWAGGPISDDEATTKLQALVDREREASERLRNNLNRAAEDWRRAKSIADKVRAWQAGGFAHPLTCGNNSSHQKLVPVESEGGRVYLKCVDCDYLQDWIPSVVLAV